MISNEQDLLIDGTIGANIRARRLDAGVSQIQLGVAIGGGAHQIAMYENAVIRVSASRLVRIARALGVMIEDLYAGLDAKAVV